MIHSQHECAIKFNKNYFISSCLLQHVCVCVCVCGRRVVVDGKTLHMKWIRCTNAEFFMRAQKTFPEKACGWENLRVTFYGKLLFPSKSISLAYCERYWLCRSFVTLAAGELCKTYFCTRSFRRDSGEFRAFVPLLLFVSIIRKSSAKVFFSISPTKLGSMELWFIDFLIGNDNLREARPFSEAQAAIESNSVEERGE